MHIFFLEIIEQNKALNVKDDVYFEVSTILNLICNIIVTRFNLFHID